MPLRRSDQLVSFKMAFDHHLRSCPSGIVQEGLKITVLAPAHIALLSSSSQHHISGLVIRSTSIAPIASPIRAEDQPFKPLLREPPSSSPSSLVDIGLSAQGTTCQHLSRSCQIWVDRTSSVPLPHGVRTFHFLTVAVPSVSSQTEYVPFLHSHRLLSIVSAFTLPLC